MLIILSSLSLGVTLVIFLIIFLVWSPMRSYVSESRISIDSYPISSNKQIEVNQKVKMFVTDSKSDTLILNSEEMNHLINGNAILKDFEMQFRLDLIDSLLKIRCSFPVNKIKNRMASFIRVMNIEGFINSEIEGYPSLKGKKLSLTLTTSEMNNQPASMTLFGKRNRIDLIQFFTDRIDYNQLVDRLKSIYIREGKIYLVFKV